VTHEPTILDLRSADGLHLRLMDQGATWLSCQVPLGDGEQREVILGCAAPADYARQTAFLGATIGRYANRIGHASVAHDGRRWQLAPFPAGSAHQLHGGPVGFDKRRWNIEAQQPDQVMLSLTSEAGDQGYPGRLHVQVTFRVQAPLTIQMDCEARVDAPSPVCITQHSYFNLDAPHGDARAQRLQIRAAAYLPVDADLIPLDAPSAVAGTSFDFRASKPILRDWLQDEQQRCGGGYDHAFLLQGDCAALGADAAILQSADDRVALHLATTLPSVQFYGGQFLAGTPRRGGGTYPAFAGVALEPQFLPDSPNHPEWPQPSCWLLPGQVYRHTLRYRFAVTTADRS
jgi:aldose 1-epimerase